MGWSTFECQIVILQILAFALCLGIVAHRTSFPLSRASRRLKTLSLPPDAWQTEPLETLAALHRLLEYGPVLLLPLPSHRARYEALFAPTLEHVWLMPSERPSAAQVLLALEHVQKVLGVPAAVVVEGSEALEPVVSGPLDASLKELVAVCPGVIASNPLGP